MNNFFKYFLIVSINIVLLTSCNENTTDTTKVTTDTTKVTTDTTKVTTDTTKVTTTKIKFNIASLGSDTSNITKILAIITRDNFSLSSELIINGDQATATISDLTIGNYSLKIEIYEAATLVGTGESNFIIKDNTVVTINPTAILFTGTLNLSFTLNSLPIANAGLDKISIINEVATLNGSLSSDPESSTLSYNWYFISRPDGSNVVLNNKTLESSSFTPNQLGAYVIGLIVSDGFHSSLADEITVNVTIGNKRPVANAGNNVIISPNSNVSLDGSLSSDENNDNLTFQWQIKTKPIGSSNVLTNPNSSTPSFLPDSKGIYVVSLVVSDGKLTSLAKEVEVNVTTNVSGIISSNTTWILANSPYLLTGDVQLAYGSTLKIEAGVKVIGAANKLIIYGTLDVTGTYNDKVILEDLLINPGKNSPSEPALIKINHSILTPPISGGFFLSNSSYTSLILRNSVIKNASYLYLWYPVADIFIEKNIFINSGGLSIGTSGDINVYIRNNVFFGSKGDNGKIYAINNWNSSDTSSTVVEYNSFLSLNETALLFKGGDSGSKLIGTHNYWGTLDTSIINNMIYDKNDDLSTAGYITYLPILKYPHIDTPDPTPYIDGYSKSPTNPDTLFSTLPLGFLDGGYSKTLNYSGSDTNNVNYTSSIVTSSGVDTVFNSIPVKTIVSVNTTTNLSTSVSASETANDYYSKDTNNFKIVGGFIQSTGISSTGAPAINVLNQVKIGSSGNYGDYILSDGTSYTAFWSIDDGFNGNALYNQTAIVKDSAGEPNFTILNRSLISADGLLSQQVYDYTFHKNNDLGLTFRSR